MHLQVKAFFPTTGELRLRLELPADIIVPLLFHQGHLLSSFTHHDTHVTQCNKPPILPNNLSILLLVSKSAFLPPPLSLSLPHDLTLQSCYWALAPQRTATRPRPLSVQHQHYIPYASTSSTRPRLPPFEVIGPSLDPVAVTIRPPCALLRSTQSTSPADQVPAFGAGSTELLQREGQEVWFLWRVGGWMEEQGVAGDVKNGVAVNRWCRPLCNHFFLPLALPPSLIPSLV